MTGPASANRSRPLVALIACNARFAHSNLALRLLVTYARQHGFRAADFCLQEYTINDRPLPLLQRLFGLQANVYAFSCYIWNIQLISQLSAWLRKIRPDCRIIWGGPQASQEASQVLAANAAVDWIIAGEGEVGFLCLLRQLFPESELEQSISDRLGQSTDDREDGPAGGPRGESAGDYQDGPAGGSSGLSTGNFTGQAAESIPGLVWRDPRTGQVRQNQPAALLGGAGWTFPWQAAELERFRDRLVYYETSRGCPYRCTYCLSALDKTVRYRPLELIFQELHQLIAADLRQVKLVDRTFNCQPARALAIWQFLLAIWQRQPFQTNFHFEIMADTLDDAAVAWLCTVPPGLFQLEIGVQSIQPHVLQAIRRPCNISRLARVVRQLRHGSAVHLHLDLIAGLPGETLAEFAHSFNTVYGWQPQQLQLGFLKVLPGSPMAADARRLAFVWQDEPPYEILASDVMTYPELVILKEIETMVDLFYNSGQFGCSLPWLIRFWPTPFDFYQQLATLWRHTGYFDRPAARDATWNCLLQLAQNSRIGQPNQIRPSRDSEQSDQPGQITRPGESGKPGNPGNPGQPGQPGQSAGPTRNNLPAAFAPAPISGPDPLRVLRDLLTFDYIMNGQKDQPSWMDSLESSKDPIRRARLAAGRQRLRQTHPQLRRGRLEDFSVDPAMLPQYGSVWSGPALTSVDALSAGAPAVCLAAFDPGEPGPRLLWTIPIDDAANQPR